MMVKSFITLDTVVTIITYNRKAFTVQATDCKKFYNFGRWLTNLKGLDRLSPQNMIFF
jgi:hypothetical protein